ncbi:MAG: hypothetical protein GX801_09825 [Fibrobacter sp.]|nr:hypothetical protein [Fibrobacter sp.]
MSILKGKSAFMGKSLGIIFVGYFISIKSNQKNYVALKENSGALFYEKEKLLEYLGPNSWVVADCKKLDLQLKKCTDIRLMMSLFGDFADQDDFFAKLNEISSEFNQAMEYCFTIKRVFHEMKNQFHQLPNYKQYIFGEVLQWRKETPTPDYTLLVRDYLHDFCMGRSFIENLNANKLLWSYFLQYKEQAGEVIKKTFPELEKFMLQLIDKKLNKACKNKFCPYCQVNFTINPTISDAND